MFMGGGVNDDLRFVLFENSLHPLFVGNIAHNRFYGNIRKSRV
jgi:hypothetical protein